MLMFSFNTAGKERRPDHFRVELLQKNYVPQEIRCQLFTQEEPAEFAVGACSLARLFGVLDELDALLGLGDQVRDHGVQGGLLGGRDGAVVQHLLHAVGTQAHLRARSNMKKIYLVGK
jgi:hypothetical protein